MIYYREIISKHLPGSHNQQSHASGSGSWFGLDPKERGKLGSWFKGKMAVDSLFPNPGHVQHKYPDAKGNAGRVKEYGVKDAAATRKRYEDASVPIPKESIYATKGRRFWSSER